MRSLEVIFPANIGDMTETKANAVKRVVNEVLQPLQKEESNPTKKLDFNIDINPQAMRISTFTDVEKSFKDTPASKIISKVSSEVFKALLHDSTGNLEVAYTVTKELKYNWKNNKTILSSIDGIDYSGFKLSYKKGDYLGDVLVQPDYNLSTDGDIKDTFFQTMLRNVNLSNTNIKDLDNLKINLDEIIEHAENIYSDSVDALSTDQI